MTNQLEYDGTFMEDFLEERPVMTEEKMSEERKRRLECCETLNDDDPKPENSLNFEEAFKNHSSPNGYESKYKNIQFLKEDVGIVNSMSHCSPDDIAKLIRNIQNSVYTLGLEEARQCRRGKLLNVLKKTENGINQVEHTAQN